MALKPPEIIQANTSHIDEKIYAQPFLTEDIPKNPIKSILSCILLLVVTALFFYPTVFSGATICKLGHLFELDSLFNPSIKEHLVPIRYDPSAYLIHMPNQSFANVQLSKLQLPLWNPNNACGYPIIGDIQSFLFSPLHFLFPVPSLIDLSIVLEVALGAIGTFALARSLKLSYWSSIFSGLSYAFCPYILHYMELPSHNWLFPWMFLTFVHLAKAPTLKNKIFASVISALGVYTIHPECYFFAVTFATILSASLLITSNNADKSSWLNKLSLVAKTFIPVAVLALLLAAPIILPFMEYVASSSFYKATIDWDPHIPWQTFCLNLIHPALAGGSPFLGAITFLLLPLSFFSSNKQVRCLLATFAIAFVMSTTIPPFDLILNQRPFSYLMPLYGLPVLLLTLSLLSAFGLERIISSSKNKTIKDWTPQTLCTIAAIIAVSVPVILRLSRSDYHDLMFDMSMPLMGISRQEWQTDLMVISFALVLIWSAKFLPPLAKKLLPAVLVALNFISLSYAGVNALPIETQFNNQEKYIIPFLTQHKEDRFVAVGPNFFLPNLNIMYGLQDLRYLSPLSPKRYIDFIQKAGGERASLYFFIFNEKINQLINLASIKYIVSTLPLANLSHSQKTVTTPVQLADEIKFAPGLRLLKANFAYEKDNQRMYVNCLWKAHTIASHRHTVRPVLLDGNNKALWLGSNIVFAGNPKDQHKQLLEFWIPVPVNITNNTKLRPAIEVLDIWRQNTIQPMQESANFVNGKYFVLAEISKQNDATPDAAKSNETLSNLKLLYETPRSIRVYENPNAMPPAYIVHKYTLSNSAENSLETISQKNFDFANDVVIETTENIPIVNSDLQDSRVLSIVRPNSNEVQIQTESTKAGILVLTDTFYPGWTATVDGKPTPVLKANYLFRAIKLPAGKHLVEFKYAPLPFWIGVALALATLCFSILAFVLSPRFGKQNSK